MSVKTTIVLKSLNGLCQTTMVGMVFWKQINFSNDKKIDFWKQFRFICTNWIVSNFTRLLPFKSFHEYRGFIEIQFVYIVCLELFVFIIEVFRFKLDLNGADYNTWQLILSMIWGVYEQAASTETITAKINRICFFQIKQECIWTF